ncbi:hypothetical protein R1sor_002078 [Riccia sorocarpa]|uniref:Stress enhanced protein 2 n=1 Tax=Riccia sorocarpa TaxID=122646 RepID=A0ABD3H1Z0_9MARC
MAASSVTVPWASLLSGGVGSLPQRRNSASSSAFLSGSKSNCHPLKHSGNGGASKNVQKRRGIVSEARDVSGEDNSRVFKSMKDAAERRTEEAALGRPEEVEIARVIADAEQVYRSRSDGGARSKPVQQPPRFATLRAFGEAGGEGVIVTGFGGTSVFELLAASIEASKQVRNWEVLSGRLAMLALSVAIGVEFFTGNSVFEGVNFAELQGAAALCAVATLSAGAFAYAWRAKEDVVYLMSKNYKNMMDSALDNLIDGLFFDESK